MQWCQCISVKRKDKKDVIKTQAQLKLCNMFQMETEMEKMQSRLEASLSHSVTLQDRVRLL